MDVQRGIARSKPRRDPQQPDPPDSAESRFTTPPQNPTPTTLRTPSPYKFLTHSSPSRANHRIIPRMKRMTDPLSPPAWPPTTFSLPQLWERITAMFAVLIREARSAASFARRADTTREERRAIRSRLIPLERLVRSLLVTEAIIHLLMTREGRALIANAKPITPPAPRAARAQPSSSRPHREPSPDKPATFRVLGWDTSTTIEDDDAPLSPLRPATPTSGRHLARRIETLTHVLNNPAPTIDRLAKFIARLPSDALGLPAALAVTSLAWWHGRPEYFNAIALEKRAVIAFQNNGRIHIEPG